MGQLSKLDGWTLAMLIIRETLDRYDEENDDADLEESKDSETEGM